MQCTTAVISQQASSNQCSGSTLSITHCQYMVKIHNGKPATTVNISTKNVQYANNHNGNIYKST